jgi:hypothetical protein
VILVVPIQHCRPSSHTTESTDPCVRCVPDIPAEAAVDSLNHLLNTGVCMSGLVDQLLTLREVPCDSQWGEHGLTAIG